MVEKLQVLRQETQVEVQAHLGNVLRPGGGDRRAPPVLPEEHGRWRGRQQELKVHDGVVFDDVLKVPIGVELEDGVDGGLPHLPHLVRAKLQEEVEEVKLLRGAADDQVLHEVDDDDGGAS